MIYRSHVTLTVLEAEFRPRERPQISSLRSSNLFILPRPSEMLETMSLKDGSSTYRSPRFSRHHSLSAEVIRSGRIARMMQSFWNAERGMSRLA